MLNLMAILEHSSVNGPGDRFVIWTQGCTKGCKGCFNPESWEFRANLQIDPEELARSVRDANPYGITLTGGDPLEQPEALLEFLKALHPLAEDFLPGGIICFTGYKIEELDDIPPAKACLEYIDLLIDGRFVEKLKHINGLSGSSNQRFHFLDREGRGKSRISSEVLEFDQAVEVHYTHGVIEVTGFPNLDNSRLIDLGLIPKKA